MAKEKYEDKNPFVGIAAVLGGLILVVIAMFLIFAEQMVGVAVGLAWAFVVLGIFLGFFAFMAGKKKK